MRQVHEHVVLPFQGLGVTHQVTNELVERPSAEAQLLVMFSVIQLTGVALIDRVW